MKEHKVLREQTIEAVFENVSGPREQVNETAVKIADKVMDVVIENYRSISEIQMILEAVRTGGQVQIDYVNPDEEDMERDSFVERACW